jgi:hypothetical protein
LHSVPCIRPVSFLYRVFFIPIGLAITGLPGF